MIDSINQTAEEMVTEISMSSVVNSPWLIVEGGTDIRFLSTRALPHNPVIMCANGWENVIEVINKVIKDCISSAVFGFIDRDYLEEIGVHIDEEKVILTDFRDIEVSMFESSALDRILTEFASGTKLPCLETRDLTLEIIKDKIYSLALKIGRLRYYSLRENIGISVKNIKFSKCICSSSLQLKEDSLIQQINSNGTSFDQEKLSFVLSFDLPERLTDRRCLCSGHDLIEILGIALRKYWGSNNAKEVSKEKLESFFRVGYSDQEFEVTNMYKRMEELLSQKVIDLI